MPLGRFPFSLVEQFFLTFLRGFWTLLPSQTFPGPTSLSIRRRSLQSATCTAHCSDAGTGGSPEAPPVTLKRLAVFPMSPGQCFPCQVHGKWQFLEWQLRLVLCYHTWGWQMLAESRAALPSLKPPSLHTVPPASCLQAGICTFMPAWDRQKSSTKPDMSASEKALTETGQTSEWA